MRNVMERWFEEIWNKGNIAAIEELLAPDGIIHRLDEFGRDATGPAAFREFFVRFRSAFPDIHITINDSVMEGDKIACHWTAEATHSSDSLGFPATGKRIRITGMSFARIRNGQVIEGLNNWDQFGMLQQLGMLNIAAPA